MGGMGQRDGVSVELGRNDDHGPVPIAFRLASGRERNVGRRKLIVGVSLVLLLTAWLGMAVYRRSVARRAANETIMSYPAAVRAKVPQPGGPTLDVRVPLVPVLLNPFNPKPRAYLYSGDFVVGEVSY